MLAGKNSGMRSGVVKNCHHFHKRTLGVKGRRTFFVNVVNCALFVRFSKMSLIVHL